MKCVLNIGNVNKVNNKGFTLIEILVALAISSVIMMAMITFMVTGTKSYDATATEVEIQTESQNTINLMTNVIMSATSVEGGISSTLSPTATAAATESPTPAPTLDPAASATPDASVTPAASITPTAIVTQPQIVDHVVVEEIDNNGVTENKYYHYYILKDNNMYYKKFGPYTPTDTIKTVEQCYAEINSNLKKCLMAEGLADNGMKINVNKDRDGNIRNVFISLDFSIDGKNYNVKNTIRPRNAN